MKLYCLFFGEYEQRDLVGVFDSDEKARAFHAALREPFPLDIEEHDLNQDPEDYRRESRETMDRLNAPREQP